jgi:hypothetical protein
MPGRPNVGHPGLRHRATVGAPCTARKVGVCGNFNVEVSQSAVLRAVKEFSGFQVKPNSR